MGWCDEVLGLRDASGGEVDPPPSAEEVEARLAALPMGDLGGAWREVSTTGLKDQTPGTRALTMYLDRLSNEMPERGIAFIEAALAGEPDDEIVMLLAEGKVLGQLLVFHAGRVASSLQGLALRQPRFRWLMGSKGASIANGMVEDPQTRRRLLAIADEPAYRAWEAAPPKPEAPDFTAMLTRSLLKSNISPQSSSRCALDLVKAILEIEDNPNVLRLLAAGMLEDLVPEEDGPVIDAVVAEAERNEKFRHLLGGVWFYGMSPEVTERLTKARGEAW